MFLMFIYLTIYLIKWCLDVLSNPKGHLSAQCIRTDGLSGNPNTNTICFPRYIVYTNYRTLNEITLLMWHIHTVIQQERRVESNIENCCRCLMLFLHSMNSWYSDTLIPICNITALCIITALKFPLMRWKIIGDTCIRQ